MREDNETPLSELPLEQAVALKEERIGGGSYGTVWRRSLLFGDRIIYTAEKSGLGIVGVSSVPGDIPTPIPFPRLFQPARSLRLLKRLKEGGVDVVDFYPHLRLNNRLVMRDLTEGGRVDVWAINDAFVNRYAPGVKEKLDELALNKDILEGLARRMGQLHKAGYATSSYNFNHDLDEISYEPNRESSGLIALDPYMIVKKEGRHQVVFADVSLIRPCVPLGQSYLNNAAGRLIPHGEQMLDLMVLNHVAWNYLSKDMPKYSSQGIRTRYDCPVDRAFYLNNWRNYFSENPDLDLLKKCKKEIFEGRIADQEVRELEELIRKNQGGGFGDIGLLTVK